MKTTAELMPKLLASIGVTPENFQAASLLEDSLSRVSMSAKIVGYKKNIFYVEVQSSTELQELFLKKREILKMIQENFYSDTYCSAPEIKFLLQGMRR